MSSTGLIDFNANYINSDIIDVNEKLTVNNIDILNLINNNFDDLSENIIDLSDFGYDSLGLCAGQTPKFVNTFNLQPHNQWRPTGSHSRSLARCRRFHPSVRACNTCRKTRAEVYKALGFPRGRLSQASVQYFRSCKLLSLGTWSSCSLSSGSYELVD